MANKPGRTRGPKLKLSPEQEKALVKDYNTNTQEPIIDIAKRHNVSVQTLYNIVDRSKKAKGEKWT